MNTQIAESTSTANRVGESSSPSIPWTRSSEQRFLVLVLDAAATLAGVLLALWTWTITAGVPFSLAFVLERAIWLLAVPLWLIALAPSRQPRYLFDLLNTVETIVSAAVVLASAYLAAFFYAGREVLPRLVAVYILWNCSLLALAGRLLAYWMFTHDALLRRVLVVADDESADATVALLRHPAFLNVYVVGILGRAPAGIVQSVPVVGAPEEVAETARMLKATDIVVGPRREEVSPALADRLVRCQEAGIDILSMSRLYEQTLSRLPIRHLGPSWIVTHLLGGVSATDKSPLAKRVLDVTVASLLAIVFLVIAPLLALAIVLESGRPVFYRQVRLGRGGRPFVLTKFRTMQQDAEPNGAQWSARADPRTTVVGRFLRRTRLDELPNLWSVLRGDLSMVGPRPERPEFVSLLENSVPLYRARLIATPGLTGWAQVNHEYGDSVGDAATKLEYDLYYVKHQSVWFDLVILARTVGTMLRLQGR